MPLIRLRKPDFCPCCACHISHSVVVPQDEHWEGVVVFVCDVCGGLGCMYEAGARLHPLPKRLIGRIPLHPKSDLLRDLCRSIAASHVG